MVGEIQQFDICVVCALAEEADAAVHEFSDGNANIQFQQAFSEKTGYTYRHTTLKNNRGESLVVLVMVMPFTGPIETVLSIRALLEEFHPRFVAMTGICAGRREKVALGDLVAASYSFHYDEGKVEAGEEGQDILQPEWKTHGPQRRIVQYLQAHSNWETPLVEMKQRLLGRELQPEELPRCLIAPIASGMAVQGNNPFPRLLEHNRKAVFLDQEVASFYQALHESPDVFFLAVKGVCDYADPAKNDDYHEYAAHASANYLLSFIQEYVTQETMPRGNDHQNQSPKKREEQAAGERKPNVEEHIRAILRDSAVVDHVRLFGVEELIAHVGDLLAVTNGSWIISLSGEGGVGKTALAYEVISRYAAATGFTRLAWASAKSVHLSLDGILLRTSSTKFRWTNLVRNMADQLGIKLSSSSAEWMKDLQREIHKLPRSEKCLLVIDNLETVEDVNEAIQYLGGDQIIKPHKILVTTRTALLGKIPSIAEKQVTGLKLPAALAFLRSIGNKDIQEAEDNDLKPLVETTEGNPLLIQLFVRCLLTSHLPFNIILDELQAVHQQFGKNIVEYLYAESLSLLKEQCGSDIAYSIMNAFCPLSAGDTVNYDDLLKYSGIEDQEIFKKALKISCDLALIRSSKLNSKYSIHSLLWRFICG